MKDKTYEKKSIVVHFRVSPHDYERLKFLAESEHRTMANAAQNIVVSYLDHFDRGDIWNKK